MINKKLGRVIAATAGVGLAFASLVSVAAPASATNPTTSFKIHLNVPASVAADWNIWSWGDCNGANDNVIGESTRNLGTDAAPNNVTQDWTPNFSHDDAYGSYAEFTVPCTVTALNNVMRTTESWNGQDAAPAVAAVVDDPNTPADETAAAIPAKPAIAEADKPFGGDNIFPAGESWWNVNTGKREYPLKDLVTVNVHVNAKLATLQSQGWNLWAWGAGVVLPKLSATKGYKGKVDAALTGVPFTAADKLGSVASFKVARAYLPDAGFLLRRPVGANGWGDGHLQTGDFHPVAGALDYYLAVGSNEVTTTAPTYVGRYGATASWANGKLTVTPVRPTAPSLKGFAPDSIKVEAKKGSTTLTCTITNTAFAPVIGNAAWATPSSCQIDIAQPAHTVDNTGSQTWEVFVQASATGVGSALKGPNKSAKVVVAEAAQ